MTLPAAGTEARVEYRVHEEPLPPPRLPWSVRGTVSASSAAGMGLDLGAGVGAWSARGRLLVPCSWDPLTGVVVAPAWPPEAGFSLSGPGATAGWVGYRGLAGFVVDPERSEAVLLDGPVAPLAAARPLDADLVGASIGCDAGFVAFRPSGTESWTAGTWFASGGLSALALAGRQDDTGGGGWYDPPSGGGERLWSALGFSGRTGCLSLGAAAAATAGLPGPDGVAVRLEGRAELSPRPGGRLVVDGTVAFGSTGWSGPGSAADGTAGGMAFVDLGYRLRPWSAGLSCRVKADETGSVSGRLAGLAGFDDSRTRLSTSAAADFETGGGAPGLDLDLRLALTRGCKAWIAGSWAATGLVSERLEVSAGLRALGPLSVEAGLRCTTSGWYARWKLALALPFAGGRLSCTAGSGTWLSFHPEADAPALTLGAALELSAGSR